MDPGSATSNHDIPDGPCLVNVNSTHTLYTGGYPANVESWLYDWSTEAWTKTGDGMKVGGTMVVLH